ncbi:hypothetical protein Poly24_41370 [Rosistilla carotiformis]|uniref:Uncharacterized protein n=1 Tax=Rosistilla carotiformis TaxID=2528017 RepID=A0A518JY00_9BACT|nr:hypothetical protein Poly24_41370 [Rosistilla carotiformis]
MDRKAQGRALKSLTLEYLSRFQHESIPTSVGPDNAAPMAKKNRFETVLTKTAGLW